jgi:hypothetical protein
MCFFGTRAQYKTLPDRAEIMGIDFDGDRGKMGAKLWVKYKERQYGVKKSCGG